MLEGNSIRELLACTALQVCIIDSMLPSPLQPYDAAHQITELYYTPSKRSRRHSPSLSSLIFSADFPFPMNEGLFLSDRFAPSLVEKEFQLTPVIKHGSVNFGIAHELLIALDASPSTSPRFSLDPVQETLEVESGVSNLKRSATLDKRMQRLSLEFQGLKDRWDPLDKYERTTSTLGRMNEQRVPLRSRKRVVFSALTDSTITTTKDTNVKVRASTINARMFHRGRPRFRRGESLDGSDGGSIVIVDARNVSDLSILTLNSVVEKAVDEKSGRWVRFKDKVGGLVEHGRVKLKLVKALFK